MFSAQPTAYDQVLSLILSSAALFLLRVAINTDYASLLFLCFAGAGIAVLGLAGLNNPRLAGNEQKLAGTMAALFAAGAASAYLLVTSTARRP